MAIIKYETIDGAIRLIDMDAVINENISDTISVSSRPIEGAKSVTDHIRPEGPKFKMTCIVTNTPMGNPLSHMDGVTGSFQTIRLATFSRPPVQVRDPVFKDGVLQDPETQSTYEEINATALQFSDVVNRVQNVYRDLLELSGKGQLFTIETKLRVLSDMAIINIEAPTEKNAGKWVELTIEFAQLTIVSSSEVDAIPVQARAKKKDKPGPQATKEPDTGSNAGGPTFALNGARALAGGSGALDDKIKAFLTGGK